MPYAKSTRTRYRRRRVYRRPYRKNTLRRDVAYLKTLVNAELHHTELGNQAVSITNAGSLTCLNDISIGDSNDTRTGNLILPRYLKLQGCFKAGASSVQTIRMMIFIWKDNTTPTLADILQVSNPNSFLDEDVMGRKYDDRKLQILRSKRYYVNSVDRSVSPYKHSIQMNGMKTKRKWHTRYDDDNATTIPIMNSVYLLLLSDTSASHPTHDFRIRFSFYDN